MAVQISNAVPAESGQPRLPPSVSEESRGIPSLASGDRLTRHEFERRYTAMPNTTKAELIEGIVYMSSPLKYEEHAVPHGVIMTWLGVYSANTPGTVGADNATVGLDVDNEVQADALLRIEEKVGGRSHVTPDGYLAGAPELIVEIAASSASNDLHDKFKVYRRAGVREYAVWQVYERRIDWWTLEPSTGDYEPLAQDDHGVIRSGIFAGLWLNVPALLTGKLADVLATLQEGLQSVEHASFAQSLASRRSPIH